MIFEIIGKVAVCLFLIIILSIVLWVIDDNHKLREWIIVGTWLVGIIVIILKVFSL